MDLVNGISGLIPVLKPTGMTSTEVSRLISKRFGRLKLGHVGTLDPDADGVLPILVGQATKLQDYLLEMPKVYSFEFKLGVATDTLDASGRVVKEADWGHVTVDMVTAIVSRFMGPITQTPPIFSAVKYKGKELYKYARSGVEADDMPLESLNRTVEIASLKVDACKLPFIQMTVECSKGTYVRTLAFDLAEALGSTGHVTKLTRTMSAGFGLKDCISIEHIQDQGTSLSDLLVPFDSLAIGLPTWYLDDMVLLKRLIDGQTVVVSMADHALPKLNYSAHVLLKSSDDRSVGVVSAMLQENGQIRLHLKRGFQCHQAS
jgi:tRNA pseudouridine55 synthase